MKITLEELGRTEPEKLPNHDGKRPIVRIILSLSPVMLPSKKIEHCHRD
jgi:hypothetical protein